MKLRGAISGFGEVAARGHLPGWLAREGVSIVAVHEPIAERRQVAMRLLKSARIYDDLGLKFETYGQWLRSGAYIPHGH